MAQVDLWVWKSNLDPLLNEIETMAGEELDCGLRRVASETAASSDTGAMPTGSTSMKNPTSILASAGT